jgi:hypothetical protein
LKKHTRRFNLSTVFTVDLNGVRYWLDPTLPIEDKFPQIVMERLTTGDFCLWQIDTLNDIDRDNQYVIVKQKTL